MTTIEIGDLKHTQHNVVKDGIRKRIHKYYQSVLITSPNKLNMKPARYIAETRAKGIPVDEKLKKCMKRQLTRLRNKSVGLINGQGNNWGGIAAVLESYKKQNIFKFHARFDVPTWHRLSTKRRVFGSCTNNREFVAECVQTAILGQSNLLCC